MKLSGEFRCCSLPRMRAARLPSFEIIANSAQALEEYTALPGYQAETEKLRGGTAECELNANLTTERGLFMRLATSVRSVAAENEREIAKKTAY